ncbi:MAG: glycosyltransferase, partial [Luteolibacter sp.]
KKQGLAAHGLVAGDTHPKKRAYLEELRQLVGDLNLAEDITFLGHRGDVREIMTLCTAVCALSQQPESFGRTVLEALALGKPVVGYDCGGVGELLGQFFPAGKAQLGSMQQIIDATTSIIRAPAQVSPVGAPFTLSAMCEGTISLYHELLGERH